VESELFGRARGLLLCLTIMLAAISLYFSHAYFLEDAHITLRYADRLIHGKGLTWNDGERVEGFSSPLWLAQNAILGRAGIDLELSSKLLGLAYYVGLIGLFFASGIPFLLLIPLATLPSLTMYAMSGMETVSYCFLLLAGTMLIDRETQASQAKAVSDTVLRPNRKRSILAASGLLFSAGALSHPEGALSGLPRARLLNV